MKNIYKIFLLTLGISPIFVASAREISNLPNYQVDFGLSPTQSSLIRKNEKFSVANSIYDERLAATAFSWSAEYLGNAQTGNINASDSETLAAKYLNHVYPDIVVIDAVNALSTNLTKPIKIPRNTAKLRYMSTLSSGAKIAKYEQNIDGIPVHAREFNVLLDANNAVLARSGYLAKVLPLHSSRQSKASYQIDARVAIEHAFADIMGGPYSISLREMPVNSKLEQNFEAQQLVSDISLDKNIRLKKIWFDQRSKLVPAYYVEMAGKSVQSKQQFAYAHVISAESGNVLSRTNLVNRESFTYRVFSENRADGKLLEGPQGHELPSIGTSPQAVNAAQNRQVAIANYINVSLESGPISTNDPWLPANATRTEGNNVFAYLDRNAINGFQTGSTDITAETTSTFTFDYAFDADANANDATRKSAVVNLFYMNNWLHDWFYDAGFNEEAGNAQADNLGRGGREGDVLLAEGQDSSGRNNANMYTPSDGRSPRMQMFLFDGSGTGAQSLVLTSVAGFSNPDIAVAGFGPRSFASFSAEVVAYTDAIAAPSLTDACEAPNNTAAVNGKIALVDRGGCNFTVKVRNAQDAGAIGVLVANNTGGTVVSTMGGTDVTVNIPSFMISRNTGGAIRQALTAGVLVNATMERVDQHDLDGTYDNAIIAHEWGHYISNRLIGNAGGLNNSQGRGMGEGWGDFLAILTFVDEDDTLIAGNEQFQGLYPLYGWVSQDAYFGMRRVPYTTNFALNALTFKHIEDGVTLPDSHPRRGGLTNSEVHNTGELWATLLWEIYAGLLNDSRYSFTQAQDLMKEYIVAGMKITPISPTFNDARDAMLAVARANNEDDFLLMLNVFAKRGLGTGSVSPDRFSSSNSGVIESFEATLLTFSSGEITLEASDIGFCSDDDILDVGETGVIKISVRNSGFDPLVNIPLTIRSASDITFSNAGSTTIPALAVGEVVTVEIGVTLDSATIAEEISFTVYFPDVAGTIEPLAESLTVVVNYSFANDPARDTEDMQSEVLVRNDWEFFVNPALTANEAGAQIAIDLQQTGLSTSTPVLRIEDTAFMSDISLVSPVLNVGSDNFSISFDHLYNFENGSWDGGVIEVSEAGGAWQDVTAIHEVTFASGYNGTITTNPDSPITGRHAFVNDSNGRLRETLNFGTTFANKTIRIRFRMGADANVGGYGWEIDNVKFTGLTQNPFSMIVADTQPCSRKTNSAPVAEVLNGTVSVNAGETVTLDASPSTDANGDALVYSWSQSAGIKTTLINTSTAIATFVAPQVTDATNLNFSVLVSDGVLSSSATVLVTVNPVNQAPVAKVVNANIIAEEGDKVSLNATSSTDPDGDALNFIWTQTRGAVVSLAAANTPTATFTAPQVATNTNLGFELTVSDGSMESKLAVAVTVTNEVVVALASTTPASSSGGGGGSVGYVGLIFLMLLGLIRRKILN